VRTAPFSTNFSPGFKDSLSGMVASRCAFDRMHANASVVNKVLANSHPMFTAD
jgi:hypothetical protein